MSHEVAPSTLRRPPRPAQLAAGLTVLSLLPVVFALIALPGNAGHNADEFLRHHPDTSRSVALAGTYVLAALILVMSAVVLLAARGIQRGRRWAWVVLLIFGLLGLPALARAHDVLGVVDGLVSVALLVTLLLPGTRRFVASAADGPIGGELERQPR